MATLQALLASVTDEQIAKCHRIEHNGTVFYLVDNERNELDGYGNTVEYEVRFTVGRGFTCTCKAGQAAFASCQHGTCKHVRWVVVAEKRFVQDQERLARVARLEAMGLTLDEAKAAASAQLLINGEPASDEVLVRVFGPSPQRPNEAEIEHAYEVYQARAWKLMR